jgi:hypothetical protein
MKGKHYKGCHPQYGSDRYFDDYTMLCKVTVDLAMQETKRRLDDIFDDLASKLSDEMLESVVEIHEREYEESQRDY